MSDYVYVVTSTELGWDCIVGVYKTPEAAEAACKPTPEEFEANPESWAQFLNEEGLFDTHIIHDCRLRD